ncbi:hypothetical protein ALC56_00172, partial [Trachymyrmex septentrionalis]
LRMENRRKIDATVPYLITSLKKDYQNVESTISAGQEEKFGSSFLRFSLSHGLPRNIDAGVSWDRCNLANVSPDCQAFLVAGPSSTTNLANEAMFILIRNLGVIAHTKCKLLGVKYDAMYNRSKSSRSFSSSFATISYRSVHSQFRQPYVYPDPGHANAPNDLSPARAINIVTCPDLDNSDGGGYTCRIFPNAQHPGVVHAKSTRSFQVLHEFLTCTKVYFFTSYVIGIKATSGGGGGHVELQQAAAQGLFWICRSFAPARNRLPMPSTPNVTVIFAYLFTHSSLCVQKAIFRAKATTNVRSCRERGNTLTEHRSFYANLCRAAAMVELYSTVRLPGLYYNYVQDKPGRRVSEDKDAVIFSETSQLKDCYLPFS